MNVYGLWVTTKSLKIRPSDYLEIEATAENSILRFEVDQAVVGLGNYIDNKLEELDKKMKRVYPNVQAVIATSKKKEIKTVTSPPSQDTKIEPPKIRRRRKA